MEPSLLETFIIDAAAGRHFVNPGMPQFKEIIRKIETLFGAFKAIPNYAHLDAITQSHLALISQPQTPNAEYLIAYLFIISAVREFVQNNNL